MTLTTTAPKTSTMKIVSELVPGKEAVAVITPDRLKALAFISTYSSEDPQSTSTQKRGYQREPMAERFPGIGRYYAKDDNKHHIPFIIISVRVYTVKDRNRFNKLFNEGNVSKIHQEFGKSVFSIVDGQHRMGGLYWAWHNVEDFNVEVPVTLYYGLNYKDEAKLFDDINTNQRKLPKALIDATLVHTQGGEETHAQALRVLALALAQDGDSVWQGSISMTGAEKSKPITYSSLVRSTGTMFPARLIGRLEARRFKVEQVAKKYWQLVSTACYAAWSEQPRYVEGAEGVLHEEPVKYRLKDVVGVAAISRLGQDILSTALDRSETDEEFWEIVTDYVSRLSAVDWRKDRSNPWAATSAGFGGGGHMYQLLYELVYSGKTPGTLAPVAA